MPRVWSLYNDEELIATFEKVMAAVAPRNAST